MIKHNRHKVEEKQENKMNAVNAQHFCSDAESIYFVVRNVPETKNALKMEGKS